MGTQTLCPDNSFLAMTERSFTTVRMERERGMPASGSLTHQKELHGQGLTSVPRQPVLFLEAPPGTERLVFSDTHGPHSSGKPRDTYHAKKGGSEAGKD